MNRFYVACDLSPESGRVLLGTLNEDSLTISEVRRFQNQPVQDKNSLQWDIPRLYQEILEGLRAIGTYEEAVDCISCSSWAGDYLLFQSDGSLITPAYHHLDGRARQGMQKALSLVSKETLHQETGVQPAPANTFCQLAVEKSRRLAQAKHLLPIADAFNYLLSGVPRIELSLAGATQLYNPVTHTWSPRLLKALDLPASFFPPLVSAGTQLGPLRPEIAKSTGLEDACVAATCSHEAAAALVGLPVPRGKAGPTCGWVPGPASAPSSPSPSSLTPAATGVSPTSPATAARCASPGKPSACGFSKSASASGRSGIAR